MKMCMSQTCHIASIILKMSTLEEVKLKNVAGGHGKRTGIS